MIHIIHLPLVYHYSDVITSAMASQITGVLIVCSTVCTGANQRQHQNSAVLALCDGNPSVTGGFPSQRANNADDVIMIPGVQCMEGKVVDYCYINTILPYEEKRICSHVYPDWICCNFRSSFYLFLKRPPMSVRSILSSFLVSTIASCELIYCNEIDYPFAMLKPAEASQAYSSFPMHLYAINLPRIYRW